MSDKQQTNEKTVTDDAIVIEADALEHDNDVKKTTAPRRWPLFTLAFIIGSATSIFGLNYYQQNYVLKPTSNESVVITPKLIQEEVSKPIDTPILENLPIPTAISSEEGEALIAAITTLQENILGLQGELQTLREQQQNAAQSQSMLESMQLHSRLTWIMKHNSHLPQIKLAWQEISLLPSLTTEQRSLAESMLKLAEQRQNDVHQWQQEIDHLMISFKPNEYDNIISTAITADDANPWLQWLIKQFSLKRSQSSQEIALHTLKNTLQNIKQGMALEQWPAGTAWTKLRAQLQLRLLKQLNTNQATSNQGKNEQTQTLQLPESFAAIQADVQTLRQAAQSWLEES
ncbi:MAG: hypothetical protein Q9M21_04915 [Mariprofundaceae bacterium]|nr:hypothetical protein [Mariprofundaceae bacterium]